MLRQMQTEYIGWMVRFFRIYRRVPGLTRQHLPERFMKTWQDIGSGSGGPIALLARTSEWESVSFTLSDLYPQEAHGLPDNCVYLQEPVDARQLQIPAPASISFFNAFHHFHAAEQRGIIDRQLRAGNAVVVAEILQPDLLCFLRILLATTLGQTLLCPLVKPFRWKRLLLTWLLPVNLITVTWDGLVSVMKSPKRRDYAVWQASAEAAGGSAVVLDAGNLLLPVRLFIAWPAAVTD